MPILRDITAKLGLDLDKASFNAADKRVDKVIKKLKSTQTAVASQTAAITKASAGASAAGGAALGSLTKFFGAAAVGFAGFKLVELASDAQETLNLLDASFKENSQDVQDWAATFAAAANRSEFELLEMAGTLGAVLNPLMDENTELASEMATNLAQLSVDLGSFFNVADSDALAALRSGIVGETEAIKRLGIVMLDSTLEAFRLESGITKTFKAMTIAEKTALRYNFILDQTKLSQGDAIRTAEGWANASKGLTSALKDLGTRLGLTILPFAEKVVIVTRNLIRGFLEWQKGTQLLKAALIVLGLIGAKVALAMLIAWAPVILPMLKFIAVVAVAALILDDFLTFMDGGNSVIGRFIDAIFGPGSATAAALALHEAWAGMVLFWTNEVIPGFKILLGVASKVATALGETWGTFFDEFGTGIDVITEALDRLNKFLLGFNLKAVKAAADFLGIELPEAAPAPAPRRGPRGSSRGAAAGRTSRGVTGVRLATGRDTARGLGGTGAPSVPQPAAAAAAAAAAGGTVSETNTVTVNVRGNATAKDATRIADAAGEAQRRNQRRTRAALTQRAKPAT